MFIQEIKKMEYSRTVGKLFSGRTWEIEKVIEYHVILLISFVNFKINILSYNIKVSIDGVFIVFKQ